MPSIPKGILRRVDMELESYTFVLLRRGPRAFEYTEDELDGLQAGHLAHLDAMRERGALILAGPFRDQPDETLRGFCLYATGLEETRTLVAADPSIRAGRMAADVMTWLTKPGALTPRVR
jgi:uncharacterized protein YciI